MDVRHHYLIVKASFAQLRWSAFLCTTTAKLLTAPVAPCACTPPCASCTSTLQGLHDHTELGFLHITSFVSHKTIAALHKDKQKVKKKFARGTWSTRKNAVTAKREDKAADRSQVQPKPAWQASIELMVCYQPRRCRLAPSVLPPLSCTTQVRPAWTQHRDMAGWKRLTAWLSKASGSQVTLCNLNTVCTKLGSSYPHHQHVVKQHRAQFLCSHLIKEASHHRSLFSVQNDNQRTDLTWMWEKSTLVFHIKISSSMLQLNLAHKATFILLSLTNT